MNLLAKPTHLHWSPACGDFRLLWVLLCSLLFCQLEIKSVFGTAGSLWWDHSVAWAVAASCSSCVWLLWWTAAAQSCVTSTPRACTLSCLPSRCKWFAASWVHWVAWLCAKARHSQELSCLWCLSRLGIRKPHLLSEAACCRGLWATSLFHLSVWSATDRVLVLLCSWLHPTYPCCPSTAPFGKHAHLWEQNPVGSISVASLCSLVKACSLCLLCCLSFLLILKDSMLSFAVLESFSPPTNDPFRAFGTPTPLLVAASRCCCNHRHLQPDKQAKAA